MSESLIIQSEANKTENPFMKHIIRNSKKTGVIDWLFFLGITQALTTWLLFFLFYVFSLNCKENSYTRKHDSLPFKIQCCC
jgi:hypothetical protein